jgi:plastocyanin
VGRLKTLIGATVVAAIAGGTLPAIAGAQGTHQVNAQPSSWSPNQLDLAVGDQITWNFPTSAGFAHDVWLIAPGEPPDSAGTEVTTGPVDPGGSPVSSTFEQAGSWTFLCKLHSFVSGGQWTGMVGTAAVGDGGDPPDPPDPPGPPGGGQLPPPTRPSAPHLDLDDLPKRMPAADLVRGLRVGAACQAIDEATMRISVRGRNARKLRLGKKKRGTLAEDSAPCDQGRLEFVLKPKRKAKKGLKRLRGSAKATLELESAGSARAESQKIVLKGKKKKGG